MSDANRLDHLGTERPPHECPFPDVHNRLNDAHYLWHEAQSTYFNPPRFRTYLNALIQALRTVTWLVQKNKTIIPDFDAWYPEWQARMRSDDVMRWLVTARNRIEKEGDLERHSVLRISIIVTHTGETCYDILDSPSLRTRDILQKIDFSCIPKDLLEDGFLRLERRWVAANLPEREILDALAYAYCPIWRTTHTPRLDCRFRLSSMSQQGGKPVPFRGSAAYLKGRLPCMVSSPAYAELWIDLGSGAPATLLHKPHHPKWINQQIARARRRYDTSILSPATKKPKSLEEWAQFLWRAARHMFERDGHHIHIVHLLHDGKPLQISEVESPTHGGLLPLYRDIADQVIRIGATEIIVINEVWTAPPDSDHPFRRAELSPERGEGLALFAASAHGGKLAFFAPVTRSKGKTKLGETQRENRVHPVVGGI